MGNFNMSIPKENEKDHIIKIMEESRQASNLIIQRSTDEFNFIKKWYGILWKGITLFVIVILFFTYKSWNDFKKDIKNQVDELKIESAEKIDLFMKDLQAKTNKKIEEEFERENIRKIIETKSQERIDLTADTIIDDKINARILPKIDDAENKLQEVEKTLEDSKIFNREIKIYADFLFTVTKAQNNDRKSYDQLYKWYEDKNYKFNLEAKSAYQSIMDAHQSPITRSHTVPWNEGIDPSNLDLNQIYEVYSAMLDNASYATRIGLIEFVSQKPEISKYDKMLFYATIIEKDSHLIVVEYAARFFKDIEDFKLKNLAITQILDWWKNNKDSLKNKDL